MANTIPSIGRFKVRTFSSGERSSDAPCPSTGRKPQQAHARLMLGPLAVARRVPMLGYVTTSFFYISKAFQRQTRGRQNEINYRGVHASITRGGGLKK